MGKGGVKLAIPLVAVIEYVYLNQRAFVDAYQLVAESLLMSLLLEVMHTGTYPAFC